MTTPNPRRPRRTGSTRNWARIGVEAARRGDAIAAKVAFIEALKAEPRDALLHFNLALTEEKLGEIDGAAVNLTAALRAKPRMEEAAQRLGYVLSRYVIGSPERLDPFGLKAALMCDAIAHQPIVEAGLRHVFATRGSLAAALAQCRPGRTPDAARQLLLRRTDEALKDDLLLLALRTGIVKNEGLERLLTQLRRLMLLELDADRFADRSVTALALALIAQGWNNDHAWVENADEVSALSSIRIDRAALAAGDLSAARALILLSLYRPVRDQLGADPRLAEAAGLRPRALRELIEQRLAADAEERSIMSVLPRLLPPEDAVSRRVAAQYENSPYPRWQSLQVPAPGSLRTALGQYFRPERLEFMDGPFDVLIAGAGTGQHALQSAAGYGENARVLAIDLSSASLAYAERRRRALANAARVEFMVADILDLDRLDRRFDVIECIGVLHHMADPWAGWTALLRRLEPGGLMYIGLYSALSRRNLAALRGHPDFPGAGCTDGAAREFRAALLDRPEGTPGAELKRSKNFWNLSEFRDLVLHECEHHATLPEIERFLSDNGLAFRGFTLGRQVLDDFSRRHPGAAWPGGLAEWQRYEADNPRTFDAMYRFWCERTDMG